MEFRRARIIFFGFAIFSVKFYQKVYEGRKQESAFEVTYHSVTVEFN